MPRSAYHPAFALKRRASRIKSSAKPCGRITDSSVRLCRVPIDSHVLLRVAAALSVHATVPRMHTDDENVCCALLRLANEELCAPLGLRGMGLSSFFYQRHYLRPASGFRTAAGPAMQLQQELLLVLVPGDALAP